MMQMVKPMALEKLVQLVKLEKLVKLATRATLNKDELRVADLTGTSFKAVPFCCTPATRC